MATKRNNQPKKTARLAPNQQMIADMSDAQEKMWKTITEDELNDFSLMTNVLDLSKKAASFQERRIYAFRWCTDDVKRVHALTGKHVPRPLQWKIVNSTTLPDMEDEVDKDLRCVARLDQILIFKKWSDHMIVQNKKMERAEIGLKTGSLEGKKHQMQDKNADVEVFTGQDHKISGSDELMGEELMANVDSEADSSPLGDLVVQ